MNYNGIRCEGSIVADRKLSRNVSALSEARFHTIRPRMRIGSRGGWGDRVGKPKRLVPTKPTPLVPPVVPARRLQETVQPAKLGGQRAVLNRS
jgi:hypothetical protein